MLGGTLNDNGMASFADVLDVEDTARIQQYIISRANRDREQELAGDAEDAG